MRFWFPKSLMTDHLSPLTVIVMVLENDLVDHLVMMIVIGWITNWLARFNNYCDCLNNQINLQVPVIVIGWITKFECKYQWLWLARYVMAMIWSYRIFIGCGLISCKKLLFSNFFQHILKHIHLWSAVTTYCQSELDTQKYAAFDSSIVWQIIKNATADYY